MIENEFNRDKSNNEKLSKSKNSSLFQSQISLDNPILIQLIEIGYNPIYSRRIIYYFHPQNIDDALEYLSTKNGIIQHHVIQDRDINNINTCYACGELKINHLDYNININNNNNYLKTINYTENEDNNKSNINLNNNIDIKINNNNNYNLEQINLDNINLKIANQIMCPVCSEPFTPSSENTIKNCGHSFCNSCWYDFLSVKIKENKLTTIKCLDYECKETLIDEFVLKLIENDNELISKYKNYKLELEVINNPNKKLCPFPNCKSYLELKDINNKNVACLNSHTFCFLCLQKPHGKLACNEKFDKSITEFAENHFLKKCPNCSIITEKNSGCNHITCSKCNFQWCWLCNEKFSVDHYKQGKCKGLQNFKPKDEYDIKLAFEGKIELRDSQRQEDIYDDFQNNQNFYVPPANHLIRNEFERFSCKKTFLIFLFYLIFGHAFFSLIKINNHFMRKTFTIIITLLTYFLFDIANFLLIIYINIIMLIPYLISQGFYSFIYQCYRIRSNIYLAHIFYKTVIQFLFFFFGGLFYTLYFLKRIKRRFYEDSIRIVKAIYYFISIFLFLIYFFLFFFLANIITIIIVLCNCNTFIIDLNNIILNSIGYSFNLNY